MAVGGAEFAENGLDANYWNANNSPDQSSAIGYIPEVVWNESCDPTTDPNYCDFTGYYFLYASGGGPSSCVESQIVNNSIVCQAGYPKPPWQAGNGVPDDNVRDLPDLALAAAGGHDGYLLCTEGSCQTTDANGEIILQNASVVGGTSVSSPAMAGIMALIEQKNGKFQGLANYELYKLQAGETLSSCNSTKLTNPGRSSSCVFQDITIGDNSVPGQTGYPAQAGYDLSTGLGSINAANLVAAWKAAKKLPSRTDLSTGAISVRHGQPIPIDITVKPTFGAGMPAGDFSLETHKFGSIFGGTLTNGNFTGNIANLPGGNYTVAARYGGNAMFASSASGSVPVNITPEPSSLNITGWEINLGDRAVPWPFNPVLYGQPIALQININGNSGVGTASGSVKILDGVTSLGTFPIGQNGNAFIQVDNLHAPDGLTVGNHSLTVEYSGDNSFLPSVSKAINFRVAKKSPVTIINPSSTSVTAGDPIELVLDVGNAGLADFPADNEGPTGTVQVFDVDKPISGKIPIVFNGPLGRGFSQAIFKTSSLAVGAHSLKLVYYGDSNYSAVSNSPYTRPAEITVNAPSGTIPVIRVEQSPAPVKLGESINYVITVRPPKSGPMPSGTVSLIGANDFVLAGPVPLTNGNATMLLNAPAAGEYVLTASYSGDTTYGADYSTPFVTNVNRGTPTVALSAAARSASANSQTSLTVRVVGAPNNPVLSSVLPSGTVQFFNSLNGGSRRVLSTPQFLTRASDGTPIYTLPVVLPSGSNLITVKYSGDSNWVAVTSNAVTVSVK